MPYSYSTSFGGGVILAPCLQALCAEIAASPTYSQLTNLGEIGDSSHQSQGYGSDHNPFVLDPSGRGVVRAIDLGGPDELLRKLRARLWQIYAAQDPRVYQFGYMKGCSDNLINNWGLPFGTHVDPGDAGHLHISVTQRDGNNPGPGGWVPALGSTARWGIDGAPISTVGKPKPIAHDEESDVNIVVVNGRGIGRKGDLGIKHLSPAEWNGDSNWGKRNPDRFHVDTKMTAAEWDAQVIR